MCSLSFSFSLLLLSSPRLLPSLPFSFLACQFRKTLGGFDGLLVLRGTLPGSGVAHGPRPRLWTPPPPPPPKRFSSRSFSPPPHPLRSPPALLSRKKVRMATRLGESRAEPTLLSALAENRRMGGKVEESISCFSFLACKACGSFHYTESQRFTSRESGRETPPPPPPRGFRAPASPCAGTPRRPRVRAREGWRGRTHWGPEWQECAWSTLFPFLHVERADIFSSLPHHLPSSFLL